MSAGEPFRHIPDIALITWHAERNRSAFSIVSPWTKIAFLFLLVIIVTVVRSFPVILLLFLGTFTACAIAGLPLRKIVLWYTLPIIFVLSLVGIMAWGEPGNPVLSFTIAGYNATLTDAGLLLIFVLLLKALIIVTYSLLVLMTTRYNHVAGLIDRIFPDPINQIFLLSYRFLFLTISLTGSLLKSINSRGGGMIRSLRVQGRIFAQVFALTFIRSLDRAERVHSAMASRGYCGIYATASPVPAPSVRGTICIIALSVITLALVAAYMTPPEVVIP
ncbi:MAG: Cobalt transport protein [Methanoregula sp. PtaU1.Bin051]|nr:MAG: Cobalt transport protein [Methanoregula sp. PtaU1.Bin051]